MTYHRDFTPPAERLEQIAAGGFEALPELIRIGLCPVNQNTLSSPAGRQPVRFWQTVILQPS